MVKTLDFGAFVKIAPSVEGLVHISEIAWSRTENVEDAIKEGDDVIGIHVSAKTIKNKVAPPFRKIDFEIHFGVGIKEHQQIFDILRKNGPEVVDGKEISVSGTGSWKCFSVVNVGTGESIIEKKFHKPKFDEIMKNREYSSYIDDLIEKVMTKKLNKEDPEIDIESYEEIKSLSDHHLDDITIE